MLILCFVSRPVIYFMHPNFVSFQPTCKYDGLKVIAGSPSSRRSSVRNVSSTSSRPSRNIVITGNAAKRRDASALIVTINYWYKSVFFTKWHQEEQQKKSDFDLDLDLDEQSSREESTT